jgi:hypothetical protein
MTIALSFAFGEKRTRLEGSKASYLNDTDNSSSAKAALSNLGGDTDGTSRRSVYSGSSQLRV